jgi:hypothetical protein
VSLLSEYQRFGGTHSLYLPVRHSYWAGLGSASYPPLVDPSDHLHCKLPK